MAFYNLMRAADRQRQRADRQAELDTVRQGQWPRDFNDQMRWLNAPTNPNLSAAENQRVMAEYAARMCEADLAYLDDVERRLAADDPDLVGWEASS